MRLSSKYASRSFLSVSVGYSPSPVGAMNSLMKFQLVASARLRHTGKQARLRDVVVGRDGALHGAEHRRRELHRLSDALALRAAARRIAVDHPGRDQLQLRRLDDGRNLSRADVADRAAAGPVRCDDARLRGRDAPVLPIAEDHRRDVVLVGLRGEVGIGGRLNSERRPDPGLLLERRQLIGRECRRAEHQVARWCHGGVGGSVSTTISIESRITPTCASSYRWFAVPSDTPSTC